jgi:hypothetical protein
MDKFRFIVGLLSIAVALFLMVQTVPALVELNKLCQWNSRYEESAGFQKEITPIRYTFNKTLISFIIQLCFFISLGVLLIYDARAPEKESPRKSQSLQEMTCQYLLNGRCAGSSYLIEVRGTDCQNEVKDACCYGCAYLKTCNINCDFDQYVT